MAVSVEVPNLGEAMAAGLVAEWYCGDGALVGVGDIVCRVECSNVAFELEAEGEGTLRHQTPAGSIEMAGAVLGVILAAGESMPAAREVIRGRWEADGDSEPGRGRAPGVSELVEGMAQDRSIAGDEETAVADDPEAREAREEFEAGPRESVVVPFPRRFAESSTPVWEPAPGDAVDFNSTLWDEPAERRAEELPEPGGSIPGLPLWEPDDAHREDAPANSATERVGRMRSAAIGDAQVLHATILIDAGEASRLAAVCQREWRDSPPAAIEDVMFRALAFALREQSGIDAVGGMLVAETESDVRSALAAPASIPFREAVVRRHSGGGVAFENASWILVSVARQGVYSCTPRLEHGRKLAFAMGAPDVSGRTALTMAFDGLIWTEGSAARLLARTRELCESPYAILI